MRLLVSELVTNGVRHAALGADETIELHVDVSRQRIRAEVSGGGVSPAAAGQSGDGDIDSGWGLHLLDALSDRWGTEPNGRMCVWFELVDSGAFVFPGSTC